MAKLYIKNITKKDLVVILAVVLLSLFILTPGEDIVMTIIFTHYPTLIMNTGLILFCYMKYNMINSMHCTVATRIGSINILKYSIKFGISAVIVYSILLYSYALFAYGLPEEGYEMFFLKFIFLNTVCFLIEQFIMVLQIGSKKSLLYIFVAIGINFLFHYYFVPMFFIL